MSTSFSWSSWLHFRTSFGNLPSSILWTYPYHWSCSKIYMSIDISCYLTVFSQLHWLHGFYDVLRDYLTMLSTTRLIQHNLNVVYLNMLYGLLIVTAYFKCRVGEGRSPVQSWKLLGVRSPRWQNFVRWHLIFTGLSTTLVSCHTPRAQNFEAVPRFSENLRTPALVLSTHIGVSSSVPNTFCFLPSEQLVTYPLSYKWMNIYGTE